jgi:hypothetical protein
VGDANADGAVDVSDGIYVERWLFAGGPAPACEASVDLIDDGTVDAADAVAIWSHAFIKAADLPALADGACDARSAPSNDLDCGRVAYAIDAPGRADGSFDATVTLDAPDFDVEGWEISLAADGCAVTTASFDGTAGADTSTGGKRSTGFARTDVTASGGVVAAVVLSWLEDGKVPATDDPVPVLSLHVTRSGGSGCAPCTLTFTDGETGPAAPSRNVVTHLGRSWRPTTKEARVTLCGG